MRKCQATKLINNLQFITINKEAEDGSTTSFLTFYIPKPTTRTSTCINVYDIAITNIAEFLEYNSIYHWITRITTLRDIQKSPSTYSITNHTDEEAYHIVQEFKFHLPEIVKREIAPIRDADDTVVYYNTLNYNTFLLPYTPIQILTIQEYNKTKGNT